jgi:murein DD-endopeptidase MepM/ murein hydrolase activator NlpD
MAPGRADWWVRAAVTLAVAHAAWLSVVYARPGLPGVVLWLAAPPIVALVTVALLVVGLWRAIRRQRLAPAHLAVYLLLGGALATIALVRTYPSAYDDQPSAVRFRLPLDGPVTVAWGGADLRDNYHAVMPDQRWAYDLLVARDGRTHRDEGSRVDQYYAYGLPVRAPAGGVVHSVRDGDPDEPPGYWRIRRVAGNHVVLHVAEHEYLFIAHLQPGSLRVAPGDRVRQGQVIGLVGNSGNSTEPHVHLHLQDSPRPYFAEPIPFSFHDYRVGDRHVTCGMPTGGRRRSRGMWRGPYSGQIVEHTGDPPSERQPGAAAAQLAR